MGTQHPDQQQQGGGGQKEAGLVQESYIKSLIQQIKILELETEYLKNQNPDGRRGVQLMGGKTSKESEAEESLTKLKAELQAAMAKIESVKLEKQKMIDRLKHLELQREDEKSKLMDQVSKLTGRIEHLEKEAEDNEARQSSLLQDLEKQGIISKDRERSIQQLTEELEIKKEEICGHISALDQLQAEIGSKQTIITQLQEKFMQSSMHILQETVKGMQDELKDCYVKIRDYEYKEDDWRQIKDKMDSLKTSLIDENADLKSQLTCVKSELDGEIRTREHRSNKGTMDSQDLLMLREKEQQLKAENLRFQTQIEKLNERIKGLQVRQWLVVQNHCYLRVDIYQDKLSGESQQVTSQELKINTQKSRIEELETMLTLSSEQQNILRKQSMVHLDKQEVLRKELEKSNTEYNEMLKKLAEAEARLTESDRRVEELVDGQSKRWEEFCRMATSMKSLSSDMLQQGQANKAVHRG